MIRLISSSVDKSSANLYLSSGDRKSVLSMDWVSYSIKPISIPGAHLLVGHGRMTAGSSILPSFYDLENS